MLIAEMPELGQISGQHAAALKGLAPIAHDSGALRGKRAIGGGPFFAYSTNYHVDVEATAPIRQAEVGSVLNMIMRTRDCFGLYPEKLVEDTAYGSAPMLGYLAEEEGIEP